MSAKIKPNDTVTIKRNATVLDCQGQETSISPIMDGYDINDTTIRTIPLKALFFEYLEYYPEYYNIAIDRMVSEIPMTFIFMKYPEKSNFQVPSYLSPILKATDESLDIVAFNVAIDKQPLLFLRNCGKYYPEFFKKNEEKAIANLALKDSVIFLCDYCESHPQFVEAAIANAVEKEPFGLALCADIFYNKYPAEVMKAIETIATNNYELYINRFSSRYPQFISN